MKSKLLKNPAVMHFISPLFQSIPRTQRFAVTASLRLFVSHLATAIAWAGHLPQHGLRAQDG